MHKSWSKKFGERFDCVKVMVVTGDTSDSSALRNLASSNLILTTPEKLDSVTRRWRSHIFLLGNIKLLMIDEVHLLGDGGKGGCLEGVICRMKNIKNCAIETTSTNLQASALRIITVSATLPNVADIATFVEAPPSGTFSFDASYRPVPLTTIVKSCGKIWKNEFLFSKQVSELAVRLLSV